MCLYLTGYMGSGKSTLGNALAHATGMPFVDLDDYTEQRQGCSIRELFAQRGEQSYRLIETDMLHEASRIDRAIIATGGGTPCFADNMAFMNRHGVTVFLQTSVPVLFRRLSEARQQRPLLDGKDDTQLLTFIRRQLHERLPFYMQARFVFCGDHLETAGEIAESVKLFKSQILDKVG